jgi:site-specific DNA-methyltransferase (adenine-specific)
MLFNGRSRRVIKMNITNEDNMQLMARYPDNHFDLAIVDPPYGIGWDKENSTMSAGYRKDGTKRKMKTWNNPKPKEYKKGNWDNAIPNAEYFKELIRVSKYQIIWGGNYFSEHLKPSGGWVVWEKGVPNGMSLSQAELAWTNKLNSIKVTKHLWAGYKKCEVTDRFHPTQKPVALYKWLLKNYAKEGDKILDTHLGSGSIAIACHDLGFDLTACELDTDYYNAAMKRLNEHKQQLRLL